MTSSARVDTDAAAWQRGGEPSPSSPPARGASREAERQGPTHHPPRGARTGSGATDEIPRRLPMTGPQADHLAVLCKRAGVPVDGTLTRAQASARIDELDSYRRRPRMSDEQRMYLAELSRQAGVPFNPRSRLSRVAASARIRRLLEDWRRNGDGWAR